MAHLTEKITVVALRHKMAFEVPEGFYIRKK